MQEALTNVRRHASATSVALALRQDRETVHLVVHDDGVGCDTAQAVGAGHGVIGMIESARRVQGSCRLLSRPGRGMTVAAARRIAQFRTSNEFGDWITVLHTFTYANAVHQAMRRAPSTDLLRGVFDAAVSVYLDRFLNMPPAPLPQRGTVDAPDPEKLLELMNTQQQVNEVSRLVSDYLTGQGDEAALLATLGQALLREDAEFHSFQMVEAGFRQYADLRGTEEGRVVLLAVARYLAAHSPTSRAGGQTYQTALRLQRGEALYTE